MKSQANNKSQLLQDKLQSEEKKRQSYHLWTYVHFALNLSSELTELLGTANYITKGARE